MGNCLTTTMLTIGEIRSMAQSIKSHKRENIPTTCYFRAIFSQTKTLKMDAAATKGITHFWVQDEASRKYLHLLD